LKVASRRILLESGTLTLGRDPAQNVVLTDPDISRVHARLTLTHDRVIVEDLAPTNGTFIDGQAISGAAVLAEGSLLGLGQHLLKLERRSRREVERAEQMRRDIDRACHYVRSLLPDPLTDGGIQTDWLFEPSAQLGGDAFGYDRLDADTFLTYLFDVAGHGAGAAMHSVSVLNVLRQRMLPEADLRDPARALASLNAMFQMDRHDGMVFTMWYAVYDQARRILRYACGGHHPAYLVTDGPAGPRPRRSRRVAS
jgi:serine phosphatase RsbU (regulator of sigma subunit)